MDFMVYQDRVTGNLAPVKGEDGSAYVIAFGQSTADPKIRYGEVWQNVTVGAAETFCMQIKNKSAVDLLLLWDEIFTAASVRFQYRRHDTDLTTVLYGPAGSENTGLLNGATMAPDTEIEVRSQLLAALPGTALMARPGQGNVLRPRTFGAFGGGLNIPASTGLVICTPVGTIANQNFQWGFQLKKG